MKVCLFVLTEFTNMTDGRRTDGQTDTAWQHRPRLCIASRRKKNCGHKTNKLTYDGFIGWKWSISSALTCAVIFSQFTESCKADRNRGIMSRIQGWHNKKKRFSNRRQTARQHVHLTWLRCTSHTHLWYVKITYLSKQVCELYHAHSLFHRSIRTQSSWSVGKRPFRIIQGQQF